MIIVGLTGNFGMGKSSVAAMFRELGAATIDTDDIVRGLLRDPAVIYQIRKAFGDDYIEGSSVNKKMLSDAIFEYPDLRISLENILHPGVFEKINEFVRNSEQSADSPKVLIVEVPVVFERGYQNKFDKIITVFTSEEIAIKRLKGKGITEEEARRRLKSQFPVTMKVGKSDFAIDNCDGPDNTRKQAEEILKVLLMMGE